jgi:rhamnose utilization protein RhaD (predicted bifunctional aldolase and dehydrogenase)/NAD(P)-dependent dehydrogenase (short-subunit alcohol dehydrogenase family)
MKSLWHEDDAKAMVKHYGQLGFSEDVALRVYTSRLLGADPRLVQHGGGNTSTKTTDTDHAGETVDVIRVKGSGWDLGDIEPAGLPAMRHKSLLALQQVPHMSDEAMVNAQRAALLDANSPNPSVETLLHAWVPAKVIDHTHANAVLALVDQSDGKKRAQDLFGSELCICDYVMPGFGLAHQVRKAVADRPTALGAILLKHGIFTWGEDARTAYERMIEMVDRAERTIEQAGRSRATKNSQSKAATSASAFLPELRGALTESLDYNGWRRVVLDWRRGPETLTYVGRPDLAEISQSGPATPDHVLRIKPWPLILPDLARLPANEIRPRIQAAVDQYRDRYRAYFDRNNLRFDGKKKALDPTPRVVLVPGVGLFGVGASGGDASIAADIAETNAAVVSDGTKLGPFESIPEADIFDVEYWSLEQAKLGKTKAQRLAGSIVAVTGGGSGIGAETARAFAAEGAEVVVLDRDLDKANAVARSVKGLALACDVTSATSVEEAFRAIADQFGGLDILVSNAGAAFVGRIGEVDEQVLRDSFELNLYGHQRVAQAAVKIFLRQGTGGALLFNASKQAVNPGPDFGPYGLPKAALLALMRQYAVDYGDKGIRANAINADRIRTGLLTDDMIKQRSAARGLTESDYMGGNLLKQEVRASDVAQGFLSLALADRTTGAILTVDGGNIAAALR